MTVNDLQCEPESALFELPPDHIVVALRNRTGYEHLGWRKPGHAEKLRCAALLASDTYTRDDLTLAERAVLSPPAHSTGGEKLLELIAQLDRRPLALTGHQIMADVRAIEQIQSWLTATHATRLARLAEPGCAGDVTDLANAAAHHSPGLDDREPDSRHFTLAGIQMAVGYLGAALCISPISAGHRIADAQDLVDNLPDLLAALTDGTIDPTRARILQHRTKILRHDDRHHVVTKLLPIAMRHNPGRFSTLVDAAVLETNPDAAETRRREALDKRGLQCDPTEDGMARFIATLPATDAQLAWDLFDAIAQGLKDFDDRCAAHRRADAFTTLIELLAAGQTVSADSLLHHALTTECRCPDTTDPTPDADQANPPTDTATATAESDVADTARSDNSAGAASSSATAGPSQQNSANGRNIDPEDPDSFCSATSFSDPAGQGEQTMNRDSWITEPDDGSLTTTGDHPSARPGNQPAEQEPTTSTNTSGTQGDSEPAATVSTLTTGEWTALGKKWVMPVRQGRRTHATITVPFTLFDRLPGTIAELAEYGMITESWARTLLEAASTVTMLVTDPTTGRPLGTSERTYRPKQDVRDHVTTAYPTCIFTGCGRPARCCDLDHLEPFDHECPENGGATRPENLYPVCRLHHRLKTFAGWTYTPGPDGIQVTSPLGTTTVTTPSATWRTPPPSPPPDDLPPF